MGRKSRIKHINYQRTITKSEHKISDGELSYLLPVLKEVIKSIHPPSSLLVETLYFIYQHADIIIKIIESLNKGDYNGAILYAIEIFGKETGENILSYIYDYYSEEYVNSLSNSIASSVEGKTNKELTKKITKGTIKGVAESINEKIIDKISEKIKKSDENEGNEKNERK